MERIRHTRFIAILVAAAVSVCSAAHADTIYNWSWSGGDGVAASGTFDVLNGYVQSATGTITGGGLGTTGSLSLITASSPGVISNPDPANSTPGSFVFQDGNGDNFEGDTAFSSSNPYVDYYGLVLAVSGTGLGTGSHGESNYAFNIWSNAPGNWQASLGGNGGRTGRRDQPVRYANRDHGSAAWSATVAVLRPRWTGSFCGPPAQVRCCLKRGALTQARNVALDGHLPTPGKPTRIVGSRASYNGNTQASQA